jgi:2'-5' RNA ligase
MKIGYGIMLDVASRNFVRRIQLDLHHQIGISVARQPPHITVKSPFNVTQIAPHREYLNALSQSIKGLEVEIDGFGHFADKVIYLNVRHTSALMDLHATILQDVEDQFGEAPQQFEGEHIKLHASVAGFGNENSFYKAQDHLSQYTPRFKFRATQLGLFYYLGPEKGWIVHHLVDLPDGQ